MKINLWFFLVLLGLTGWLGWDKLTGTKTDLSFYIKQISEMSQVVKNLQANCNK